MRGPKIITAIPGPRSMKIWEKEKKHITTGLAPGTQMVPVVFKKGEGALLQDVDGNVYIDFAAGMMTTSTGHCHPEVVARVKMQAENLFHAYDSPTPDRHKLCSMLAEKTPGEIDTFEFYNGGTETVEAALRAAISYNKGKDKFLSFNRGFHGKTMGARMLMGQKNFGPVPDCFRVPYPYCYRCEFGLSYPECKLRCAENVIDVIQTNKDKIAAMVFEPILGSGGIAIPPEGFWEKVTDACKKNKILIIADEILTGVGRTGKLFACEHWGIEPDMITFGKGLGSGFPVVILGGKRKIMTSPPYGNPGGASTTFGGNPLAVVSALSTLEIIEKENVLENALEVGKILMERLTEIKKSHPLIGDVRGKGLLFCVDLVKDRKTKERAAEEGCDVFVESMKMGLRLITPGGNLNRITPPLNISKKLALKGLDIYEEAISKVEKKYGYTKE